MKYMMTLLFAFFMTPLFSQSGNTQNMVPNTVSDTVTFITKIDIENATKDGIYLNGYVVNIDYDRLEKLNGKKVRITGKVSIIRGLKNSPERRGDNANKTAQQGREEDTKYIESPLIKIIED